jgi:hypothetical protein
MSKRIAGAVAAVAMSGALLAGPLAGAATAAPAKATTANTSGLSDYCLVLGPITICFPY